MNNLKEKNNKSSKFQLVLDIKSLFTIGLIVIIAIAWAFILGVIIGRGYEPIDIIDKARQKIIHSKKEGNITSKKTENKVLKPTQLTFYNRVKQNTVEKLFNVQTHKIKNKKKKADPHHYIIQISSFSNRGDAIKLANSLKKRHLNTKVQKVVINHKTWYRVYVVIIGTSRILQEKVNLLKKMGFKDCIIKEQ